MTGYANRKEKEMSKLGLRGKLIWYDNHDASKEFTAKEAKFLKILLQNRKKILARSLIAQTIWGENWEEKYSDWALDRLAYRLRKKLQKLGLAGSLQTVKRKGFCLK